MVDNLKALDQQPLNQKNDTNIFGLVPCYNLVWGTRPKKRYFFKSSTPLNDI